MRRLVSAALMLVSLACVVSTVVDVVRGSTGLWSPTTLGSYLFHFATMLLALVFIADRPKQASTTKEDA